MQESWSDHFRFHYALPVLYVDIILQIVIKAGFQRKSDHTAICVLLPAFVPESIETYTTVDSKAR